LLIAQHSAAARADAVVSLLDPRRVVAHRNAQQVQLEVDRASEQPARGRQLGLETSITIAGRQGLDQLQLQLMDSRQCAQGLRVGHVGAVAADGVERSAI
jgi:hypothetical protein